VENFTSKNAKILSKIAFESTKFAKLNQYKALRTLSFIKAKSKRKLSVRCDIFFPLSIGVIIDKGFSICANLFNMWQNIFQQL